jgi:hypothetical protein
MAKCSLREPMGQAGHFGFGPLAHACYLLEANLG